jgi:hypothetical protein
MQVMHIAYVRYLQKVLANGVQIESDGGCLQQHPAEIPQQYPVLGKIKAPMSNETIASARVQTGRRDNDCRHDHRSRSQRVVQELLL